MALESGGKADKLGNTYESRWVVRQLLYLIKEEIVDVRFEPLGEDEPGVDVWVTQADQTRMAFQCKLSNGDKDKWSIADLNGKGILSYAAYQLERDSSFHYALVSPVGNQLLHHICESARSSNGSAEDFHQYQILCSQERQKTFNEFCHYLKLDTNSTADLDKALGYLSRFHLEHWPDTHSSMMELESFASLLVSGKATEIIASLKEYAANNLGRKITATEVRKQLSDAGYSLRNMAFDERLAPKLNDLQDQFKKSTGSQLVAGELIERTETQALIQTLSANPLVVIHGRPGFGKSSVLLEFANHLDELGYTYLPIRLDRQIPTNSTRQFGIDLGLPESPVLCLASLAQDDKPCVLLLDQLDVLRWTHSHSKPALEVCKSLITEAQQFQKEGKNIHVILSSRTYDLEHDPEISGWIKALAKESPSKIEIKPLPEEAVKTIVQRFGEKQVKRKLLAMLKSPHHLAMWVELAKSGATSEATNRIQLMQEFWAEKIKEAVSLGAAEENDLQNEISTLANYMERNGCIHAPVIIGSHQSAIDALLEVGILQADNSKFTFAHQSYLDYFIAERLVRQIFRAENNMLDWLGEKESQTLFKREQLRQALTLLSEQLDTTYLETIKSILFSDKVRFHLKHLALEVSGNIENPSDNLCQFCFELYNDQFWQAHILDTVYFAHAPFIDWLEKQKILTNYLNDENHRDNIFFILGSVSQVRSDLLAQALQPLLENTALHKQILNSLNRRNMADDAEQMFELRLKLAEKGEVQYFMDWETLSAPRQIALLAAVLQFYPDDYFADVEYGVMKDNSAQFRWDRKKMELLIVSAKSNPQLVWEKLLPHLLRFVPKDIQENYAYSIWLESDRKGFRKGREILPHSFVSICIAAAEQLASNEGRKFWQNTTHLRQSESLVIRYLLVSAYSAIEKTLSDTIISWILSDLSDLAIGTGYREPKWSPMVKLIEALSPHCSDELFKQLETRLYYYKEKEFIRFAKNRVSGWREGWYRIFWGEAQYFLLPALCETRRSQKTNDLINVLQRKFNSYDEEQFVLIGRVRSGTVRSSIPRERVNRISDRAWLKIISNTKLPEDSSFEYRKGSDGLAASSIHYFAQDMAFAAKCDPQRFAQLALRFPQETPVAYKTAIIEALTASKVKDDIPEPFKQNWRPADHGLILQVLEAFAGEDGNEFPERLAWLVYHRSASQWFSKTIDSLIDIALHHADPQAGKLNIHCDKHPNEVNTEILESNAINCTRGVATLALGQLLWQHDELHALIKSTLLKIAEDTHPAVLVAVLQASRSLLNTDRDFIVQILEKVASQDLRIAASRGAIEIFNCCAQSHYKQLRPIVLKMFSSASDELQQHAATEMAARWVFHDLYTAELKQCLTGEVPHRQGVAAISADFIKELEYQPKCRQLLNQLKNDSDEEVQSRLSRVMYEKELYQSPDGHEILSDLINSNIFEDCADSFFHQLEDYTSDILPFADLLLDAGFKISKDAETEKNDYTRNTYYFSPLLLRLYDQAFEEKKSEIVNQCLDIWDQMFLHRISGAKTIAEAIE